MPDREIWRDPNGSPLKFQDGDYVRIDTSSHPERASRLPFLAGYVRGYDAFISDAGADVGYELFSMGNPRLHGVKEEVLEKAPDPFSGHVCYGGVCGICGSGGRPQGLSIFAGPKVKEESRGE